jgi:DNA invertase Pin-like site-specific DNA recombinase
MDLDVVAVEVDAGFSAKSLARPAIQRALDALTRGSADVLVITKLDRLTRSVRDLADLVSDYFADGKRGLISLGESIDTTSAAGRLVLNLLTSVAEWERQAIGERTRTALTVKRERGERLGGHAPYGFRHDGDRVVAVEDEQRVIATARKLRATGLSLRGVADTLAARGQRSRTGRPFTASAVAAMVA